MQQPRRPYSVSCLSGIIRLTRTCYWKKLKRVRHPPVYWKMIMRKTSTLSLFVYLFVVFAPAAASAPRKITTEQAHALVLASLTPEQSRLTKLNVLPYDSPEKSIFWFFTITWAGTPTGSVVVGNYAVDPYTGDVFSASSASYEYKSAKLQSLQAKVRESLHLSRPEYERLKTKGPLCDK